MKKTIIIFLLSVWMLAACDVLIPQAVQSIQKSIETVPPQVVVTKEVIVKTIEQVMVTTTPIPTATPTPIPSFLGTPIQPDPALQRAVAVSLAALGTDFDIRLFTRTGNGDLIVWVRDARYPETLLCGAPLYFPGLGSLLVLTTGHFYATINQHKSFASATGCAAIGLTKGKAQVQKILETYQGIYSALRSNKRFSSAEGVHYYVQDYLAKQKNTYPYEVNMVLLPMVGEDLGRTSAELECPRNMAKKCMGPYQYDFTGMDITYENSTSRHVPVAYGRFFEQTALTDALQLLGERARKLQTSAAPGSLLKTNPLSIQEILTLWFDQNFWEQLVYSGAFSMGLGTVFPNVNEQVQYTNPAFTPLLPMTGVSHMSDAALTQHWAILTAYFNGKAGEVSSPVLDAYIQYARARIKNTYFDFIVFEQK